MGWRDILKVGGFTHVVEEASKPLKKHYNQKFRLNIVEQVESGKLTSARAAETCGVTRRTINRWRVDARKGPPLAGLTARELLELAENMQVRFQVEGNKVCASRSKTILLEGKHPLPAPLLQALRARRAEVLEILERRPASAKRVLKKLPLLDTIEAPVEAPVAEHTIWQDPQKHLSQKYLPVSPGKVIKEICLDPLGLTIADAAQGLGVSRGALSAVINGHRGISAEMAIRLSKAFGASAESWLLQQAQYDLWHAVQSEIVVKTFYKNELPRES